MKNVLEKTGHKKAYYDRQRFFRISAFSFALLLLAAIPVGISYRLSTLETENTLTNYKEEMQQTEEELSSSSLLEE